MLAAAPPMTPHVEAMIKRAERGHARSIRKLAQYGHRGLAQKLIPYLRAPDETGAAVLRYVTRAPEPGTKQAAAAFLVRVLGDRGVFEERDTALASPPELESLELACTLVGDVEYADDVAQALAIASTHPHRSVAGAALEALRKYEAARPPLAPLLVALERHQTHQKTTLSLLVRLDQIEAVPVILRRARLFRASNPRHPMDPFFEALQRITKKDFGRRLAPYEQRYLKRGL